MMLKTFKLGFIATVGLALTMAALAWRADREDLARLNSTIAAQKKLIDAADTRERDRNLSLQKSLAQIENLKHRTKSPAQLVQGLNRFLPLPSPVTLSPPTQLVLKDGVDRSGNKRQSDTTAPVVDAPKLSASSENPSSQADKALPSQPTPRVSDTRATISTKDLQPLYAFVQDCRECEQKLSAAEANAADDRAKIDALQKERDGAVSVAKGGGGWKRLRRECWWFVIGVGAGAGALEAARHRR
jgi:hypothetical protein